MCALFSNLRERRGGGRGSDKDRGREIEREGKRGRVSENERGKVWSER